MKRSPQVPPEQFVDSMKEEIEQYVKEVMEAVNQAPDGEWIIGSEERVRDLSARPDSAWPWWMARRGSASRCNCI